MHKRAMWQHINLAGLLKNLCPCNVGDSNAEYHPPHYLITISVHASGPRDFGRRDLISDVLRKVADVVQTLAFNQPISTGQRTRLSRRVLSQHPIAPLGM